MHPIQKSASYVWEKAQVEDCLCAQANKSSGRHITLYVMKNILCVGLNGQFMIPCVCLCPCFQCTSGQRDAKE